MSGFRFFDYRDNCLHAEGVPLARIAAEYGTPTYVYSRAALATAGFPIRVRGLPLASG